MNASGSLLAALLITLFASTSHAELPERTLDRARESVEKKDYEAALTHYSTIAKWLERDPGLLVEWARVYSYANRHSEAIALFEAVAAKYPERAKTFEKELADQRAYLALNLARGFIEKKDYASALSQYDKIATLEDKDVELTIEHARALTYANRHKEAIKLFEKAGRTKPATQTAIKQELEDQRSFLKLEKARLLVKDKKYTEALEIYEKLGQWLERDPGLLLEWARAYSYANRNSEAERLLKRVIAAGGVDIEKVQLELKDQQAYLTLAQARSMVEAQDYEGAIQRYSKLSEWLDRDPGLVLEWARVCTYANRHEEALALFEKAIKLKPSLEKSVGSEIESQKAYLTLEKARGFVEREDYEAALTKYEELSNVLSRDPGLMIEKARVYSYAKRHAEAAEIFEQILAGSPEYVPVFLRELGDMYTWERQFDRALAVYEQAISRDPEALEPKLAMARALAWKGDTRRAHEVFDEILSDHPDHVPALIGKADTYTMDDRLRKAAKVLSRALELEPGNFEALNMEAKIMVWQGYHRKGADRYREILDLDPESLEALDGLAHALHWDGRDSEAIEVLDRLLALRPTRAEARRLMFRIRSADRPYLKGLLEWSDDTHPRDTLSYGIRTGVAPNHWLALEGSYIHKAIEEDDGAAKTDVDTLSLKAMTRPTQTATLNAKLSSAQFEIGNWTKTLSDFDLKWRPVDVITLRMNYERDTIDSIEAIENRTYYTGWGGGVKWKPDRLWTLSFDMDERRYSDYNRRDHLLGTLEFRLMQTPYIKLYYNYYDLEYLRDVDGYFSPQDFYSHTIGAYAAQRFSLKWYGLIQGSLGTEHHDGGTWVDSSYQAAELVYKPTFRWECKLRATHFRSADDADAGLDGYETTLVALTVSYSMGGEEWDEKIEQDISPAEIPDTR